MSNCETCGNDPLALPEGWPLNVDMQVRAQALRVSRDVLKTTGFASSTVTQGVSDLIRVAMFIVKGGDDDAEV